MAMQLPAAAGDALSEPLTWTARRARNARARAGLDERAPARFSTERIEYKLSADAESKLLRCPQVGENARTWRTSFRVFWRDRGNRRLGGGWSVKIPW